MLGSAVRLLVAGAGAAAGAAVCEGACARAGFSRLTRMSAVMPQAAAIDLEGSGIVPIPVQVSARDGERLPAVDMRRTN